jgi:mannose/fructose/N-acetylgalactosamine-specific phosphotransferase system component IIC
MSVLELLPLALLGGIVGLDMVSFPQAMISRPIVAASLGGALVGHPLQGLLAGAVLELIALETLPVGASRYPEWGSASVVGGALFAGHSTQPAGALTLAVLAAVTIAWIGGWSMYELRRLNAYWSHRLSDRVQLGDRNAIIGLQLRGLTADLARGAFITFVSLLGLRPVMRYALAAWSVDATTSRAVVGGIAAASAFAAAWTLTHGTVGARWCLLGGLAIGVVLLGVLT